MSSAIAFAFSLSTAKREERFFMNSPVFVIPSITRPTSSPSSPTLSIVRPCCLPITRMASVTVSEKNAVFKSSGKPANLSSYNFVFVFSSILIYFLLSSADGGGDWPLVPEVFGPPPQPELGIIIVGPAGGGCCLGGGGGSVGGGVGGVWSFIAIFGGGPPSRCFQRPASVLPWRVYLSAEPDS